MRTRGTRRLAVVSAVVVGLALAGCESPAAPADGGPAAQEGSAPATAVTDEVVNRVQEQFPALALVPDGQLRDLVSQACGAVTSGSVAGAQQLLQDRFRLDPGTAQQVAEWLDQNVCAA